MSRLMRLLRVAQVRFLDEQPFGSKYTRNRKIAQWFLKDDFWANLAVFWGQGALEAQRRSGWDYGFPSLSNILTASFSNREKANHFFPRSLREAPMW